MGFSGIIFGAMYLSQHYFIDLVIGAGYAVVAIWIVHRTTFVQKVTGFFGRLLRKKKLA